MSLHTEKHSADIALAFDFGERRIGVAVASTTTENASELGTIHARSGQPDWQQFDRLIAEWRPGRLIVGLPYNADGNESSMTDRVREFIAQLDQRYQLPVDTVDERLTSVEAGLILRDQRQQGLRKRRTRKEDVDRMAARLIAESWLRGTGTQENDDQNMQADPPRCEQLSSTGKLHHLLTLDGLPRPLIIELLDRAESYLRAAGEPPARDHILAGRTVANLFFEPSTRTRASFELAAKRMSADVLNLDVNMSSRKKGESILDTIYTLQAMQVDIFVIRDASEGVPALIASKVQPHVSVLNAGEASTSHPTQGLLDLLTIRQHKLHFEGLSVAIVGDIAHSRVARSVSEGLRIMGTRDLRLIAPPGLEPEPAVYPGAMITNDLDQGLAGADVVMALRIQRERMQEDLLSLEAYQEQYGLTYSRLARAKPDVIVMHPGPMNRGVEIMGDVADGPHSVINQQVTNGLAVRMALLASVLESRLEL